MGPTICFAALNQNELLVVALRKYALCTVRIANLCTVCPAGTHTEEALVGSDPGQRDCVVTAESADCVHQTSPAAASCDRSHGRTPTCIFFVARYSWTLSQIDHPGHAAQWRNTGVHQATTYTSCDRACVRGSSDAATPVDFSRVAAPYTVDNSRW